MSRRIVQPELELDELVMTLDTAPAVPVEFLPWAMIPADRKRGAGDDREVLGQTWTGAPAWLPWMGRS